MKKKAVITMLVMCMAFSTTACGASDITEPAQKEESAGEDAAAQEAGDETDASGAHEPEGFGDRLVSVDHVEKYIKLAEYKGLVLEKPETSVTEEQIDTQIRYALQGTMEEVTGANAVAQNGDTVTINFIGTKDGIAFEGGSADNFDLTLGEGGMIDGFEDGILGMKKGETKDLDLTFPENYFEESLAGQAVVFQITVQKIQRAPELTDAWVEANTDVSTVEEYRSEVEKNLKASAEAEAQAGLENNAWVTVYTGSEVVEYPEADIRNAKDEFESQVMQYAGDTTMTLEEFVESQGLSMDEFNEQTQQYAEGKVKQNLIIQGIMDAENITLDDAESMEIRERLAADYMVEDLDELISMYGRTAVYEAIGFLRVEKFLVDNAMINSETIDASEDVSDSEEPETEEDGSEEISGVETEEDGSEEISEPETEAKE